MKRGLWFAAGAGAGVYAMVRARGWPRRSPPRAARPAAEALAVGARMFARRGRAGPGRGRNRVAGALRARASWSYPSLARPPARAESRRRSRHRRPTDDVDATRRRRSRLMDTAEIRRRFVAHFERRRAHRRAVGVADPRRPDAAVRQRRHGAVQAVLPRPGDAAVLPRGRACRSACAPSTSRRSARPPATARSSRCAATSPSATTSRKARSARLGAGHQSAGRRRLRPRGERLWPSILHDDDEAVQLWTKIAGLPDERIQARHDGELLVDGRARPGRPVLGDLLRPRPGVRPDGGRDHRRRADEDRYLEIWNLVFMQDELRRRCAARTTSTSSASCPRKNIDTGMGLERVASSCRASTTSTRST